MAPTDAGDQLLSHLSPALTDVEAVLDKVAGLTGRPTGRVRLVAPRLAAKMVVAPRLEPFTRAYPDVVLEITTDDSPLDFVAGRYDAGIHLGEFIARDMIAVRVSQEQRAAIVAAPRYFASHPKPESPRDLTSHRCVSISMGSAGPYRWEFDPGQRVSHRGRARASCWTMLTSPFERRWTGSA
jgi:DNA-binding transcriptional LysR family regulator